MTLFASTVSAGNILIAFQIGANPIIFPIFLLQKFLMFSGKLYTFVWKTGFKLVFQLVANSISFSNASYKAGPQRAYWLPNSCLNFNNCLDLDKKKVQRYHLTKNQKLDTSNPCGGDLFNVAGVPLINLQGIKNHQEFKNSWLFLDLSKAVLLFCDEILFKRNFKPPLL